MNTRTVLGKGRCLHSMYYLARTVRTEVYAEHESRTELVMKSSSKEKLQAEIKRLFDEAIEEIDEDCLVNNCIVEDFDEDNGYFDSDNLSIEILFPSPGMEREIINYTIVSDENVEEV